MPDNLTFGEFIRKMRLEKQQPMRVVAAAVEIDSTLLSKLEHSERFPTDLQISRFAKFFNIPSQQLKARVIVDKIMSECGGSEAAAHAADMLKERAPRYTVNPRKKP